MAASESRRRLIDRIQDRNGATIFRADQRPCERLRQDVDWQNQPVPVIPDTREQVADPGSAFQIVTMLQGVVERGTGTVVKAVGKPIAGKTGTTNDWRDAWFVGFTPDLAAGVYIGFDDPDSLGDDETGGHVAAPVFRDFMIAALKDAPATAFRTPPGHAALSGQRGDRLAGRRRRAGDLRGLQARHRARPEPMSVRAGPGPTPEIRSTTADRHRIDRRRADCGQANRGRAARRYGPMPVAGGPASPPPLPPRGAPGAAPAAYIENAPCTGRSPPIPPPSSPARHCRTVSGIEGDELMRAEIQAAADDITKSLALLRRHL